MLTDIEIAQGAHKETILKIAKSIGIKEEEIELYGSYKAKINLDIFKRIEDKKNGKLILVTAINPTPAGEGKTTTTIGLGQAMNKIGKQAIIALRQPSLGPSLGRKGGAAGGGYSQVIPMEDINLNFTGDIHAISAAHALVSSSIDNHLFHGNTLNIDPKQILWKRSVDMNDRALRNIVVGLGQKSDGVVREEGFIITVASELMAILCLAENLMNLKERAAKIIIGYTYEGTPVTVRDLNIQGAIAVLLKDAIKPNLIQTLENTPCLMHGGPFANIAHGCNSLIATKMGLKLSDYVITEAGFGADLGAEKFFDIKCRIGGLHPDAVVLVATIRSLKYNGGKKLEELETEDLDSLKKGIPNLGKHIENIKKYGVPLVVALNLFSSDTKEEISYIVDYCREMGVDVAISEVFKKGGDGGVELAKKVIGCIENTTPNFEYLYDIELPIKDKIRTLVEEIYGGDGIVYTPSAEKAIKKIEGLNLDKLPICVAKTQYSLSDNQELLGRPKGFKINVKDVRISNGAGFLVILTGDIMVMPGLPKAPAANVIDIDENGKITGLF